MIHVVLRGAGVLPASLYAALVHRTTFEPVKQNCVNGRSSTASAPHCWYR